MPARSCSVGSATARAAGGAISERKTPIAMASGVAIATAMPTTSSVAIQA